MKNKKFVGHNATRASVNTGLFLNEQPGNQLELYATVSEGIERNLVPAAPRQERGVLFLDEVSPISVTFSKPFISAPHIQVTMVSSDANPTAAIDTVTTTGFIGTAVNISDGLASTGNPQWVHWTATEIL